MLKQPLKLFGNELREEKVRFIHSEGSGYWFLMRQARLAGERDSLRHVTKKNQRNLWIRSWLIVRIINENLDELSTELYKDNLPKLTEAELEETKKDDKKLKRALEEIVTSKLSNEDLLYHPVTSKYKEEFTNIFLEDDETEGFNEVIKCAFKYRYVLDESNINVDPTDPEKGILAADKVFSGQVKIGDKITQEDINMLDENLLVQIHNFCMAEFNNEYWLTTNEKEKQVSESAPTSVENPNTPKEIEIVDANEEKKIQALAA